MGCRTLLLVCLGLLVAVTLPGCGGCLNEDPIARKKKEEEQAKQKEKEKPKKDYEIEERVFVQPRDVGLNQNLVKPGHWMTATQQAKANNFDFQAELESAATRRNAEPIDVENTAFRITMSRPVSLPKGQNKQLETLYFVPHPPPDSVSGSRMVWLQNRLRARQGGQEVTGSMTATTPMPDYQYFLVVLASDPNRYSYLKRLDSVVPPLENDREDQMDRATHYRVVMPIVENRVLVPSHPLAWTTIAYVLWDGLNPNLLTPDQQQAIVDWLHWGGQMIVSGPNSLDTLRGSFLDAYLPARGGAAVDLTESALAPLDTAWSLKNGRTGERAALKIMPDKLPTGIELQKHPEADCLAATGQLVIQRRVGAGRIVVTAFSLSDRQIINWGSYDSFFNACLLHRPHRTFQLSEPTQFAHVIWTDHPQPADQLDAQFVTRLRYFTRDVAPVELVSNNAMKEVGQLDVAGWKDSSGAANAVRQSLKDAAGIAVPKAGFVLRVLAIYLLVLAPLNWLFFRAIGRLEWAWIAAPLIAIVGAIAVVRLAQLDIGFARSRTEIAVLELQGGYRRGHLTRYTALYSSLSTAYDLLFDDGSALALPFPSQAKYTPGPHETVNTVQFRRDRQVSLSGFQVSSNSTGLVHSEQMYNLNGTIELVGDATQGLQLRNTSPLSLRDAGVLWRDSAGKFQVAWVGVLEPGQSQALTFSLSPNNAAYLAPWRDSPTTCSYEQQQAEFLRRWDKDGNRQVSRKEVADCPELLDNFAEIDSDRNEQLSGEELLKWCIKSRGGALTLGRLFELACRWNLDVGDFQLVGWTDRDLPGLTIRPRASQETVRTMVLVHLRRGQLPPARPDVNLRAEFPAMPVAEPLDNLPLEDAGS